MEANSEYERKRATVLRASALRAAGAYDAAIAKILEILPGLTEDDLKLGAYRELLFSADAKDDKPCAPNRGRASHTRA